MQDSKKLAVAFILMTVIPLALYFVPVVCGIAGGFAGGARAGGVKRGLMVAVLPAIIVTLGLWQLLVVLQAPVVGFSHGPMMGWIAVVSALGIFAGATVGGALAHNRRLGTRGAPARQRSVRG